MTLSLEQLSARMRQGEDIPLSDTARIALALSIPSILEQLVVTAMEYIDAAMVGHIGAEATAAIGIVSSSTWLLHGILVGLYTAFSIQIAQYLGADRRQDARGVLRQSMLFNLILGLGAAAFGVGISRFLPGWLGADISLQADASAYFAIWSAALPFTMAMGMYTAMLRATGDALTPSLISVLVCVLDVVFNFFLINPTRQILLFGQSVTVWGSTPATGPAKSKSTQILLIKFLLNNISYITITITILFYSHTIPLTVTSAITAGDFFTNRIRTKRARTPASGKSTAICDSFLLLACLSDTTVQCTLSPDTSRT